MSLFMNNVKQLVSGVILEFNRKVWDLYVSKKDTYLNLKVYKDKTYSFFPYGYITERLYRYSFLKKGSFEPQTFEMLDKYVQPGHVVMDIGTNIGIYSLFLSEKVGTTGKIVAFEPDRKTFSVLKKNLEKNNCTNVIAANYALSDYEGMAAIGLPADVENENIKYTDAFNIVEQIKDPAAKNNAGNLVEVKLLDNYIKELGLNRVDVIKIDIEGAELFCFKGAENILRTYKPVIIFEGDEERVKNFDYSLTELLFYIHNLGYKLTNYEPGQWLAIPEGK